MDEPVRLEDFVGAHHQRAVRLAFRLLGNEQAALDVVQDAFLKASDQRGTLRDPVALEAWTFRVLVRLCSNRRRWLRIRAWVPLLESPAPAAGRDPVLRRTLLAALDRLTARQREAFVLVRLEGMAVREAAAIVGCAEGTLKSHLHRALTSLRTELAETYAEVI